MTRIDCTVNGITRGLEVDSPSSLLELLRERLGLRGTKGACTEGECGACTVLLDGEPVCSCLVMALDANGCSIVTIEGMAPGPEIELHPVQAALLDAGGVQCGFCTPGIVMVAAALMADGGWLAERDLRDGLAGNLCRCTGYGGILRAMTSLQGRG